MAVDTRKTSEALAEKGRPQIPAMPSEPYVSRADTDRFRPGEPGTISGHIAYRKDGLSTANTPSYSLLAINDGIDRDPVEVPCWHADLAELVQELDPQPGDAIALRCFGQKQNGFGYGFGMSITKATA